MLSVGHEHTRRWCVFQLRKVDAKFRKIRSVLNVEEKEEWILEKTKKKKNREHGNLRGLPFSVFSLGNIQTKRP